MSRQQLSAQKLQEIRDLAAQWGQIVARRVAPQAGPAPQLDFMALEQIAAAAAAGLTEGALAALLSQQAQALPDQLPCPDCGHLCPVGSEARPLTVKGGQLTLREPVCHCPACRRDFFPPADPAPPGQPQLQPDRVAHDR
jgi:hypothetical protein